MSEGAVSACNIGLTLIIYLCYVKMFNNLRIGRYIACLKNEEREVDLLGE